MPKDLELDDVPDEAILWYLWVYQKIGREGLMDVLNNVGPEHAKTGLGQGL